MSSSTRVFLSFAPEDANFRSLLVAASRAAGLPVRFVEVPHHVTDVRRRHALCRAKLQQCDMAIVLTSSRATRCLSVETDVMAVRDAGLPIHAIMAGRSEFLASVPAEWGASSVHGWNWPRILEFLQRRDFTRDAWRRAS